MPNRRHQKIEISHDILAKEVYARIDADDKMRLKIDQFLQDRYDYYIEAGVLLEKQDIDYISPYLEQVKPSDAISAFIDQSADAITERERKRRRRNALIGFVLATAALVSIFFGVRANRALLQVQESEQMAQDSAAVARNQRTIAEAAERKAVSNAKAAADSAKVAQQQRLLALEALKKADDNAERANRTLRNLNTTRRQVVDVLIEQAQDLIYNLEYEEAQEKLWTASDLVEDFPPLGKILMEDAFYWAETYQFVKAGESGKKAARQLGKNWSNLPTTAIQDTLQTLSTYRQALQALDQATYDQLRLRYFPDMVTIPGGTFEMGCDTLIDPDCRRNEKMHTVTLSTYKIAKTETTWWQYRLYGAATGKTWRSPSWGTQGDHPVVNVSWYDAVDYLRWLNRREGREATMPGNDEDGYAIDLTANGYRLPTEAEWAYAAREARPRQAFIYSGSDSLDLVGWYGDSKTPDGVGRARKVSQKQANALGLYDMSGNVWEWCWDWYASDYDDTQTLNPTGADRGTHRVFRGGGWGDDALICRVSNRRWYSPDVPRRQPWLPSRFPLGQS